MLSERGVLRQGLAVLGRGIRDEPRIFAFAVTGSCMFGLATVATAYVVGNVVGNVIEPAFAHHRVDMRASLYGALSILAIAAVRVVGIFGRRLGAGSMQYRLQARYRRLVTRRYLELPLAWHQRHATGELLSNANADVEAAWYPIAPLPFAVGTVVMLIGAVASLFVVDWALALVSCAIFPGLFGANYWYARRMSPRISHAQQLRAEVSAAAHESFDGALVVKTMGREAYETERFAAKAGELRSAMINVGRVRGLFDPILDALPSIGTLAVLIIGGIRLRQGAVSLQDIVSVGFLFSVLAVPVRAIGFVLGELPRAAVGFSRVRNVITATGEMGYGSAVLDKAANQARNHAAARPADSPSSGATADRAATNGPVDMRFEHVAFAYPSGPPVLRDVTFTVPAGATVALVGPTGAGKSTIAALATRLMDPAGGRILLGGIELPKLSAESLAGTVALVPQVPFVFDDTVAGNVALDRAGVDDDAVAEALRVAQADRFVDALPNGLDTSVGERGTSLSGGQRQRLTLARALAGRPRLLVIDDATSAVDPRVEAAILAALRDRSRGAAASILVVAYRRATIALADVVVYVEHGRVVATGSHEELLATAPGYAALVTAYETAEAEAAAGSHGAGDGTAGTDTAEELGDDERELVK